MSKKPYQKFFKKNTPWKITQEELLEHPEDSLGFELGCFLLKNDFEIQPQLEDHDVIHVLTNTGISVREEIGMQYYLFGNGKKSFYMFMVILSGTTFYINHLKYFFDQYKRGKNAFQFHYLDYSKMLMIPIKNIQQTFKIN